MGLESAPVETRDWSKITRKLLPAALVFVVCVIAVGWHVAEYRHLGPLDEQAHLDYVNRIGSGHLPELGQKLNRETRRQVACRGLETPVGFGDHPDCDKFRTDDSLPENANSYEAGQPPLYYAVTAIIGKVMPGDDVDSFRRVGGLWLGIGAVALFLTLRRLKVAEALAVVVTLVLALTPPLLFGASVVSNDIAVWTFGAIALFVVVVLMQQPTLRYPHLLIGAALGALGGFTKPSALLIIGALALCVVLQQWWAGRVKWGLLLGASMLAGAAAATGAWGIVVTSVQQRPIDEVMPWARYRVSQFNVDQLFRQPLFNLVSTYRAYIPASIRGDWVMDTLFQAAVYVQVGLLMLPVLVKWPEDPSRSIGISYSVAVVISGPYYVALYYVATHILYAADTRFAFGLIPFLAVLLAVWVPNRWQRWSITGALALPVLWYWLLLSGAVNSAPR